MHFLEPDTGLGAGIHGEETRRLGWGGTIEPFERGEISVLTIESEKRESEKQEKHLAVSWRGTKVVMDTFPEEAVFKLGT